PPRSLIRWPHFGQPAVPTAKARGTSALVIRLRRSSSLQPAHSPATLMMSSASFRAAGYFATLARAVAICSSVKSVRAVLGGYFGWRTTGETRATARCVLGSAARAAAPITRNKRANESGRGIVARYYRGSV